MAETKLLFSFSASGSTNSQTITQLKKLFAKAGAQVVNVDVPTTLSQRVGVTYRSVLLTFGDGQTVTLNVKDETGDVFEIRINGSVVPLRNQDDHAETVKEVAALMNRKRAAFQRAAAKAKTPLPAGIKATRVKKLDAKRARRDELQGQVDTARTELQSLTGQAAT